MKRAIGMKSARVNFGCRPKKLVHFGKAGDRDNVHKERVAVRFRVGGDLSADGARRAGLGIDDRRHLDDGLQDRGERPGNHVGSATWREWIDERNCPRGISVRAQMPGRMARAAAAAALPATKWRLSMESPQTLVGRRWADLVIVAGMLSLVTVANQASRIATARVQPAEAPRILWGKQLT